MSKCRKGDMLTRNYSWSKHKFSVILSIRKNFHVKNFHVWNSHLQHAARLFQKTPYDRLFLSDSWASCPFSKLFVIASVGRNIPLSLLTNHFFWAFTYVRLFQY